jgi:hypothetical protein
MTVCPFCQWSGEPPMTGAAGCPRCGRAAADYASFGGAAASSRMLDTDFDEDAPAPAAPLELAVVAHRAVPAPPPRPPFDGPEPARIEPPSDARAAPAPAAAPARPPDGAAIVANYPPPPSALWEAPVYALKVLWRQLELRQDLASLRRKRSPDVGLYERALKAHDPRVFALGLALGGAALAIATFVFFLPVILRFLHAP